MVVLVAVVMAASAAMAVIMIMMMVVIVRVAVIVMMLMGVSMAVMTMMMPMTMVMVLVVAVMGALLGPEGALHRGRRAALPASQLGQRRGVRHVDRIAGDFGEAVLAAEMPGEAHEAQRIFGPDLQKALGRRPHLDEPPILEPQGIAVVDGGLHVEIEQDLRSALPPERRLTAAARSMVEDHRIDDSVGLHGGFADDGGNAGHGSVSKRVTGGL